MMTRILCESHVNSSHNSENTITGALFSQAYPNVLLSIPANIFCIIAITFLVIFPTTSFATEVQSAATEHEEASISGLGSIDFPTSGSPQAQPWFLRGVLLLHNFQYDDSGEAFRKAQELDPGFALAYWGEAMTENHPIWGEQNVRRAQKILNRFAPSPEERLSKIPTVRERAYLKAVDILYSDKEKSTRDRAYVEAMRQLTEQFPEDLEAAAFYALAILGSSQGERNTATYMKAAAIAEEVFQKNPRHPGAVHYLIHSYDDPIHAPLGLRAARVYANLAPAASHAQHMPSHIFMALGMWEEVIRSNEAAWASSEARIKRKQLSLLSRPYHTLKWLLYAYLQVERMEDARQLLNLIQGDAQQSQTRYARGYRATMRAIFIVETEEWDIGHLKEDRAGLRFSFAASELFAIGMSAINIGNLSVAKDVLNQLKDRIGPQGSESLSADGVAGLSMVKELEGLILLQEAQPEKALTALREATTLEDSLPYDYGPPLPIKPTHELLGEVLVELGQFEEAKNEFTLALARAPERRLALKGMTRASQ